MDLRLTAEIHRDGQWYVAFCPEFPEANGQGETEHECLQNLRDAVALLLEDRRVDAKASLRDDARLVELA